jgi:hypothetical protein
MGLTNGLSACLESCGVKTGLSMPTENIQLEETSSSLHLQPNPLMAAIPGDAGLLLLLDGYDELVPDADPTTLPSLWDQLGLSPVTNGIADTNTGR